MAFARTPLFYLNVLVVGTCGLIYELLAGTLASYVLGDSVTQFSLIIGIYLSAMGVGAWLSGYIDTNLVRRFLDIELAVGLVGGLSAPLFFLSFAYLTWFSIVLYGTVFVIGVLVGLEIPLLMRILREQIEFKDVVSRVLTFDYLGALLASLLFPIFLVPKLGLMRTGMLFGMINVGVAFWGTFLFSDLIKGGVLYLRSRAVVVLIILSVGFVKADSLTSLAEEGMFDDAIVYAKTTRYQRIVMTRAGTGFKLFLSGNLQFSSADEYRYHEALVHPAMATVTEPKRILVLGGGDGLAVREILRHPSVEEVVLVDLDPAMTDLGHDLPSLVALNKSSLHDSRVKTVTADAMTWLADYEGLPFDVAIVDFPDPNNFALGKLYTRRFYKLLASRIKPEAPITVQSTSPLYARVSYWCIVETIKASGFKVLPFQATVPSFGVWGYVLARRGPDEIPLPTRLPEGLRFLNSDSLSSLFKFPVDMGPVDVEINRLNDQRLVRYYEDEWRRWQ
ncbi:MAG: polyamine aminopropyltransferase [Kofleriaceae bacterium]|nr:polyamine aminopropyltransferase [Kofleriaceae bacterium]